MGDSGCLAFVRRRVSRPFAFLIVENIDRTERQEIVSGKLYFGVIDDPDCRRIARDRRARARGGKKRPRRAVVHRPTQDVGGNRRRKQRSGRAYT